MTLNLQKEEFSVAYLHTLVSTVGYKLQEIKIDDESVDCEIRSNVVGQGITPRSKPKLGVQLKATSSPNLIDNNTKISFPLSKKNYDELSDPTLMVPNILLVLLLPSSDPHNWIAEKTTSMEIFNKMYYLSLMDYPSLNSTQNTKTVDIPLVNILNLQILETFFDILSKGGKI